MGMEKTQPWKQSNLKLPVQHDEKDVLHLFDLGKACGMPSDAVIQAFDIVQDDSLKLYLSFAWCSRGSHWSSLEVTMPFMPSTVMGCQSSGSQIDLLPCKYDKFPKFALVEQIMMVFAYRGQPQNTH